MSTTYWAVFLGMLTGYLTITLLEGIVDEVRTRRHTGYLEYLEDQSEDFFDELRSVKI